MNANINAPIWLRSDGLYETQGVAGRYASTELDFIAEVEAYLAEHPEALVPEPVPPPPSPEEIAEQERQANLAYLASTDWYAIRFADTGEPMPEDIKVARQAARDAL